MATQLRFVSVSSSHAIAGPPQQFTVMLPGLHEFTNHELHFDMDSYSIPVSWYNVPVSASSFIFNGAPMAVMPGQYSAATLVSAMNAATGLGTPFAYNRVSNTVRYTPVNRVADPLAVPPVAAIPGTLTLSPALASLLGLSPAGATIAQCNMIPITTVHIVCANTKGSSFLFQGRERGDVISSVPVTQGSGQILAAANLAATCPRFAVSGPCMSMTVELRDQNWRLIDMDGVHWSMTLRVTTQCRAIEKSWPSQGQPSRSIQQNTEDLDECSGLLAAIQDLMQARKYIHEV